MVDVI